MGTASRALNPETRMLVNEATALRVNAAAEKLGYQPNPLARGLKTNRSMSIGVVIPDLTNALFPPIVRGIEDALVVHGYSPLLVNTDNDAERESMLVGALRRRQVDGLVFATARLEHPTIARLASEHVPIVLVNRWLNTPELPTVTSDAAEGVELGLQHLVDLGHTEIAHLAGPQWTSTGQARLAAFREGMAARGLDPGLIAETTMWSETEGMRATGELITRHPGITAVLAGNDLLALGCYDYMSWHSISCPSELSVVGFNDTPFMDKVRPGLTTIALPQYEIGVTAGRLLLNRIKHPHIAPVRIVLPVSLTVRGSTAPPPAAGT